MDGRIPAEENAPLQSSEQCNQLETSTNLAQKLPLADVPVKEDITVPPSHRKRCNICKACWSVTLPVALILALAVFLVFWIGIIRGTVADEKCTEKIDSRQRPAHRAECTGISVQDVWIATFPKLLTESAVRMLDVNKDGFDDVIIGFATGGDGYNIPEIVCDIYFESMHPCFGGVLALNGLSGAELWRTYTAHEIFGLNCNADLNNDGQKDCLAGGRAAVFLAIDTVTGHALWTVNITTGDLSNFYTPQIIGDLNWDGIPEILVSHGGDPLREPGKQVHIIGLLLVLDGRTGSIMNSVQVPDGGETYYSPQIYESTEGFKIVLFGTGGETHGGSLFAFALHDLLSTQNDTKLKAVSLLNDPFKGIMVPPVLVDITGDGIVDIVMALYNSTVVALDGRTFKEIWRYSTPGSETYSTPAAGFYDDDLIPDFFIKYSVGPGYPIYYYAESTVINGKTGRSFLKESIRDVVGSQASSLSISVEGGKDYFLYWLSDCRDAEVNSKLWYKFVKGTKVHQQSRANTCKLRFKTDGISRMYALSERDQVPGWKIYDSDERREVEHRNWVNTSILADRYLAAHPDWTRSRRHVGPHDGEGIQRLISTGSLAESFGTGVSGMIDLVIATYWFYPAKAVVVLPADQFCIDQRMKEEVERFNVSSRYFGMDHDEFENTVEEECLSNHRAGTERGESYRDLFQLKMGSMTVYRLRLKCSDGRFYPITKQHWAAYMGSTGNSLFN